MYGLTDCVLVRLFVSNKRQNDTIDQTKIGTKMTPGKVYGRLKLKFFPSTKF